MILISNHLMGLEQFKDLKDVIIRINLAHVKDEEELKKFLGIHKDIFLDYPKGRTKPPKPVFTQQQILKYIDLYTNIKYFAVSNIETASEVKMISSCLPERVSFVPKIETLKGVLNLDRIFQTGCVKYIMLDSEDLYTDIKNDVDLYTYLQNRVVSLCEEYNIKLLNLYGVIFKDE